MIPVIQPDSAPALKLAACRTVGRWTLKSRLGTGAFGEIWQAVRDDGTAGAVKLLAHPPEDELRALAGVSHPAIPRLLDAATEAPWYIAMTVAPGQPLDSLLAANSLRPNEVMQGVCALFDALAAVHAAGQQHGDIKPENIVWRAGSPPEVSLVDFGLSHGAGGTLAWAAPEHLGGAPVCAAADVYSLALVTWTALVGAAPHPQLTAQEALVRRAQSAPAVPEHTRGPAWMHRLLETLLTPHPAQRPSAAEVVDILRARGIAPAEVDGALLLRRASTAMVSRNAVDTASRSWIHKGGKLVVVGPPGSGRSRMIQSVSLELAAAGRRSLRMLPLSGPWASVESALGQLGQLGHSDGGLPEAPDDPTRVAWCVDAIAASGCAVLVHDYHVLDRWSRAVVDRLAETEADVLVTCQQRPAWAPSAVRLQPLDADQIGELLTALLGQGGDQPLTRRAVWSASRGLVGDAIRYLVACVDSGALVRSGSSWVLDRASAAPLKATVREHELTPPATGTTARMVVDVLAHVRRGLTVTQLSDLLEVPIDRLSSVVQELAITGLVLIDEDQVLLRPALESGLRSLDTDRALLGRTLAWFHRSASDDLVTRAWLAIAADDADQLASVGHPAARQLITRNPLEAARLADALWERLPDARSLDVRLQAMVASGQLKAARALGERHLDSPTHSGEHTSAWMASMVTMADLETHHGGRPGHAIAWCQRARLLAGPDTAPSDRLVLAEAHAHSMLGAHETAAGLARRVATDPPPTQATALRDWLRARTIYAQSIHQMGDLRSAIEQLESVPHDLGRGLSERAVLSATLGRLLWFAGRHADADRAMAEAGRADSGLGMLDRARLLNNLGAVRHHSGDRLAAVGAWEQALVLFNQLEATVETVRIQANLCVGYRELGRWERSRQAGEAAWGSAQKLGAADLLCHAALNLGELFLCQGQLVDAERRLQQAAQLARTHQMQREDIETRVRLVELEVRRKHPRAQLEAESVARAAGRAGMVVEHSLALAFKAVAVARSGGVPAQVESLIQAAMEPLQKAGAAADLAVVRTWVAEALLSIARPQQAATELDRARVFARERGNVPLLRRVEALAARLPTAWTNPGRDARIGRLVEVAVAINEQSDLRAVFNQIAQAGLELLDGDRAFVLVGQPPQVVASVAHGPAHGRPSMSVVEQAMRDGREVIAADVDERGDLRALRSIAAMELRSVLCVPMKHHDEVIGAIYVDARTTNRQYLSQSAELMRGLAAMAAVAVVNMRLFEESVRQARVAAQLAERERVARELADKNAELERLNAQLRASAVTDPLTGIGNRRLMVERLSAAFQASQQGSPPLSVIIADIDHFKRINDTWGHQTGDHVIQETARRIQGSLRDGDRVFRFGGEELVVLTHARDTSALDALGERLRCALADAPMQMDNTRYATVTASFGASRMRPETDTRWEEILQRADAALYNAKARGRNQMVLDNDTDFRAHESVA